MKCKMKLKIKKLINFTGIDAPAKPGDAGYDLYATTDRRISLYSRFNMPLGIAIEIPEGYVGIIEAKSGRANKEGLTTIGNIIDSGYRGEIHAQLVNTSKDFGITIKKGQKVAQIIFQKCYTPEIEFVEELSDSSRGKKGFGSTGLSDEELMLEDINLGGF